MKKGKTFTEVDAAAGNAAWLTRSSQKGQQMQTRTSQNLLTSNGQQKGIGYNWH